MMKKLLFTCMSFLLAMSMTFACDEASTTINSVTDNQDGTFTYSIDLCVEFLGLEGSPDWFQIGFSGGTSTGIASFSPATVTTATNDDYNGAIVGSAVRWSTPETFPSNNATTFCNTFTITVNGQPDLLTVNYHDTYPGCTYTEDLSTPCAILAVTAGAQTACDPVDNTYTQEVVISFQDAPTTGSILVNGQSFAVGVSPQTVLLTGLDSDGMDVNVSIGFSDDAVCNYTEPALFTAPASCEACTIDLIFGGAQSACDPATSTYSQDVIVNYANAPATGTLDVNGQSFPITTSPQVVTLMGLATNGLATDVTAVFSDDAACTFTSTGLFIAPADCSASCAIDAISAGTPSACDMNTSTFTVDITVEYVDQPATGTLDINGQSFPITFSPQTETVTLPADGNLTDITVTFSDDTACTLTAPDLFMAPDACIPVTVGCTEGVFTDSGTASGDYDDNENIITSFCSGTGENLQFLFNPSNSDFLFNEGNFEIAVGDTLFVYDGVGIGGMPIDTIEASDDPGEDHFFIYSLSGCITFQFISDGSGDDNGWVANYSCVPSGCGTNPPAADEFADAPFICNLDGFCGSTVGYTGDFPFNMAGGDQCGGATPLFGGTIQNNSWVNFQAADTDIVISVTIPTCYNGFSGAGPPNTGQGDGLQIGIFEFDGSAFTLVSECASTDGVNQTSFDIVNTTPLTIGGTYYIMIDGNGGAQCDYYFTVDAGSVTTVNAGEDDTICNNEEAVLTATGPTGAMYSWTGSDGSGPFTGTSITVNPATTTTYTVEVIGGGTCEAQTDDVLITVDICNVCSIDAIVAGDQTACDEPTQTYMQDVIVTYTNAPVGGNLIVNGQMFANTGVSPQTVTLMNLPADGLPVDVTASFSVENTCTLSSTAVFTAPTPCITPCSIDNVTGAVASACDVETGTYTATVTVTSTNAPTTGDLYVNGILFPVTASPQTVTLTDLVADGNPVNVLVSFTENNGCSAAMNPLFDAPAACASCDDGFQNGLETGLDCGGPECPACPVCFVSQYYSGAILTGVYQTSATIGTNALIFNGFNVTLLAGCINMDPGFETQLGAEFLADPVPCTAFQGETTDLSKFKTAVTSSNTYRQTTVEYIVEEDMTVNMTLRSVDGSFNQVLVQNEKKQKGHHGIQIDMSQLDAGVYMLALKRGNTTSYEKVIVK